MPKATIWNDKIILHVRKDCIPDVLKNYAKYNEKMQAYLIWFGQQNLKRLHSAFRDINDPVEILRGQERINQLKLTLSTFKDVRAKVMHIKTTATLPEINYKVAPLGFYQHRGVHFLISSPIAPLFADCGCLSGDTKIKISRGGASRTKTLEEFYDSIYDRAGMSGRGLGFNIPTYTRTFKDSHIGLHLIKDVLQQGVKDVFKITLQDGKTIKATSDHEFLTLRGWIRLDELIPNSDEIMVDNLSRHQKKEIKNKPKKCPDKSFEGYSHFGHGIPEYSKVISIVPAGKEMTYDIVCEDPHRNFVANGMVAHNCGKTFMNLVSTEQQMLSGMLDRGRTLVCGKLPTLETGWMEDVEKFTNLKAVMVWLPPSTYKRKEKMLKLLDEPADLYITNHETIMTLEEALAAKKFQKVVVDESTILKSFRGEGSRSGGKFGKSLMKVAAEATWRVIMSGTPAPNGPEDLWGQFNFLDPDGILLEPSFSEFQNTYMKKIYFGKPPKIDAETGKSTPEPPHKWITPNDKVPLIKELVLPFVYQVKIRDHLKDLPERTIIKRPVLMSNEQHEHYIEMRTALSTIINDQMVAISVRIAQVTKLRQITGGFLIDQTEMTHEIESATKLDSLDDLLEEIGDEKVIIYAQYRWEIKTIAQRYKNKGVVTVFGENKVEDSLENIKEFIKNPDVKIIVLNPKSCAYGITFVVSHYMIFYSISHSELENYQCIKRIERAGQKHPMFIYYLISRFAKHVEGKKGEAAKTIDEAIYDALQLKAKNQEELLDQTSVDMNILRNL